DRVPGTFPLAQVLMVAVFLMSWDGFRRFLGRAPATPWRAGTVVAVAMAPLAFGHLAGSQAMQSLIGSLEVATVTALIARELLWPPSAGRVAQRATGGVYVLTVVFFLGRAVAIATSDRPEMVLLSDRYTSAALLWMLSLVLATTLGMALMTSERLQEELNHQASRDPLTGALNRRAFALLAQKALARCRRQGEALAVLVMDLDHFKQINDRHGHAAGDTYLCRFVAVAEQTLRAEDVVCRFGGEEFVALMPAASPAQALSAAERLRTAFADAVQSDPTLPVAATVSIGIGALDGDESIEDLLQRADEALYLAKHNGRNRCELAQAVCPA
ncbi:MAG TPA: GGDEF domain-containing protein, partial [Candidatus Omnitrophota bacterium]|nr:GGDEF domain-containing protein [Candidatus Omnitrophota bacterium]